MRGIKRSEQFEDIVRMLAEGQSVFPTMRELMLFAAVLGFEHDRKRPLQSQTNEIDGRIFSGSAQALDFLYLIALAGERNVDVLREENEEKMIEIFEQYAQGGFEIIAGWLSEKPEDLNGDQALLSGLARNGFLSAPSDVDNVIENVSF